MKTHGSSDCHQQAICEEEHADSKAVDKSLLPCKIQPQISPNSGIVRGIKYDQETVSKFHSISYQIALQR